MIGSDPAALRDRPEVGTLFCTELPWEGRRAQTQAYT
jgi:hypothetical protein